MTVNNNRGASVFLSLLSSLSAFTQMRYCLKSTAHYMLWSWRFRLLSSVAAWTIPVRGWSWTSSSPTMRHAWSTWRVCAGRKGLCAWAVAGWERSGEHRGGVSSAHTVEGQTSVLAGNRVPPHALAPAYVVSRCLGAHEPEIRSQCSRGSSRRARTGKLTRQRGSGSTSSAGPWSDRNRDQLSGVVQVDESYVGGVEAGVRGRETIKKAIVAIAAEVDGRKIGRIRLALGARTSPPPVLRGFVKDSIAPASTVHTDGWPSYQGLAKLGFRHTVTNLSTSRRSRARAHVGRTSGGVSPQALGPRNPPRRDRPPNTSPTIWTSSPFASNRRTSRARGLLFYRLLEQAVQCAPTPASALYLGTGRGKRPAEPR